MSGVVVGSCGAGSELGRLVSGCFVGWCGARLKDSEIRELWLVRGFFFFLVNCVIIVDVGGIEDDRQTRLSTTSVFKFIWSFIKLTIPIHPFPNIYLLLLSQWLSNSAEWWYTCSLAV